MNRDKLPTSSTSISETAHRLIDLSKSNFYSMMVKNHLSCMTLQQNFDDFEIVWT
jgi:hypothetical protein